MDADDAGKPDWWLRARALEQADQLEAAEALIRSSVPTLHFAHAIADLYRARMNRMAAQADRAGALDAYRKARTFIYFFASMATSGSEGEALSAERDAFMTELIAEFGADPGE